jgi:hypothetical protein
VLVQLAYKNLLVLFVDELYLLCPHTLVRLPRDLPGVDLAREAEPDGAVVVLDEVTPHFQDFEVVHLLNEVADFDALLPAVFFVFALHYQMHLFAAASEVVLDLTWLGPVNVLGVKHDLDWLAGALLGPHTSLKHSNVFFVIVFLKPCFFLYVDTINNIVIGSCLVLGRVSFIKEIAYTDKVGSWLRL